VTASQAGVLDGRMTLGLTLYAETIALMTVHDAIAAADLVLPGRAAPEGEPDPRWQAVLAVGEFIETDPEPVWSFVLRWGCSSDADLRMAIATCVLEHVLEHHFEAFITRIEKAAQSNHFFASTVSSCWNFGHLEDPDRAARLNRLLASVRERTG
jgi:hypothetical protein